MGTLQGRQLPARFNEYDPQSGEALLPWLVRTAVEQIDPFVRATKWYLRACLTGPAVTAEEYFTTKVVPQRSPPATFMDIMAFPEAFKTDSSIYLHWSEFFEEGDPNRKTIHDAYKSHRKASA